MALELILDYGLVVAFLLSAFAAYKFFVISGKRHYLSWLSLAVAVVSLATLGNIWIQMPGTIALLWIERIVLLAIAATLFYVYYSKWG